MLRVQHMERTGLCRMPPVGALLRCRALAAFLQRCNAGLVEVMFLEPAPQSGAVNSQVLGYSGFSTVEAPQQLGELTRADSRTSCRQSGFFGNLGQMPLFDLGAATQDDGAFDNVYQLSYIAGVLMGQEQFQRIRAEAVDSFPVFFAEAFQADIQ